VVRSGAIVTSHPDAAQLRSRARDAAATGAWAAVYECLHALDVATLTADDLDLAATAAWWLIRLEESVGLRQRSYAAFVDAGDDRRASFCAWYLWFDYRFKGDGAIASGWLTRAGRHVADDPECAEAAFVLLARTETARTAGDVETAQRLAAEALELGLRLRNTDVVAMATTSLGECAIAQGRVAEGVAHLDDAMCSVVAGELTPLFTGLVYCGVLTACFAIADLRRASEWTAAAVAWCDSLPSGSPYHGICRVHRVEVTTLHGAWDQAEADAVRASEELLALEPGAAGEAFYAIGEVRRRRGDLEGAEAAFVRAHELGRNPQPGLSLLRLCQERLDDASALLQLRADALAEGPLARAIAYAAQVDVALATGDLDAARRASEALDELVNASPFGVIEAFAALARAALLLATDDVDGAREYANRACAHFRELRLPHEAALARVVNGLAARAAGDADGGRLELEAAHRALVDLGATFDAERVATLLHTTGADRPCGLTPREVEVLRLVAAGKTNREIAREMYLSEHTVSRHLQNMFAKLDVSSRAAATAFAYQHELV
jgi:DNA-binding NarL/FixJ family response regulator